MIPPFSIPVAMACLDASAEAYSSATIESALAHVLMQEREMEIDPDRAPEWCLVIAFRGTKSIKDWMTDGRVALVPEFYRSLGQVHAGFLAAWQSVQSQIEAMVQDDYTSMRDKVLRPTKIFVAGHSLGGGLATLCAKALRFPVTGVYTFGQPRVGNAAFAKSYDARLKGKTFRFVNEEDLVPRVPLPGLLSNYRHAGREIFFPSNGAGYRIDPPVLAKAMSDLAGWAQDFVRRRISCVTDHFVAEYQLRMKREFGPMGLNANAEVPA